MLEIPEQLSFDDFLNDLGIDTTVYSDLRRECISITDALGFIREYGIGSDEGQQAFIDARVDLIGYVFKVDYELYPLLEYIAKVDESKKVAIEEMTSTSSDLFESLRAIYSKFTPGALNGQFITDFVKMSNKLSSWLQMQRELIYTT